MADHIAKDSHVIDWKGAKVVDMKRNQRLRQVKEVSKHYEPGPEGIQTEQHLQVFGYHKKPV